MVRFKNRYLALELVNLAGSKPVELDIPMLLTAIFESIKICFGAMGHGQCMSSIQVKYLCNVTSTCVIRCRREHAQEVWAAITLMSEINRRGVILRLLHMSGNVEQCRRAALQHHKKLSEHMGSQRRLDAAQQLQIESAQKTITAMEP
mmetsp:Transcript_25815/g.49007  ORF Transcript_25815/g.49007 Transcript_25815/m.49007 type:complete len:148 (+) Transcript_25815:187-630(+)|eukprot:CAMPEP_0114260180 /NCGR_PEP_ID=MMETSP0058-20121206/20325_1 /TAXON_ID=36894 /ORGANISM="Pyramimonas parkeae, CCMP726" /LENGTH=147 /DNA_ID=CAMNT_0001375349 /DNA_START=119 /DNA_END=562 /DNA_ORIENTATION=-